MAIHVDWDDPERSVVRYDFPAIWSWSMFGDAMRQCAALARRGASEVHLVLDLTRTAKMPEGGPFHLRNALAASPVPIGYVVVAGTSPSVNHAFALLCDMDQAIAERVIPVRSLDAARAVLSHPYSLRTPISPANIEDR